MPDDPAARATLDAVAVALDAVAASEETEAARAAAAVGGPEARARLVGWVSAVVGAARRAGEEGVHAWRFAGAVFLLQPLLRHDPPFEPIAGGEGALELARTAEGAALVERWLVPQPGPDPARVVAATDLGDLTADEAYAAYADGRIDSRRLMAVTGETEFFQVWGQLARRGLALPVVPTHVGPGRDDRDLLWEALARGPEEETPPGAT
jgi:hypothetical protein